MEQKAQKQDRFLRGGQIAYLIHEQFRVTGTDDSAENYTDLFTIVLRNDDIQEFDSKWDGILLSMTKIPHDDILEPFWLKPFWLKAILLTRVDLFVLDLVVFSFTSRQLMGRNRKWVLEDSIQDAVWKTILRGPRPPSVRWEKERNQSAVANPKKELKWKDTGAKRHGNASSPKVVPSQPHDHCVKVHLRCGSSREDRKVAGCNQRLGDADTVEKESLVKSRNVRKLKQWCHPSQSRSSRRRDSSSGREKD